MSMFFRHIAQVVHPINRSCSEGRKGGDVQAGFILSCMLDNAAFMMDYG